MSGSVRHQDREVTVVSVKVSDGALVSFHEVCLTGQKIASLLLLHLENGTFQLGNEIQDLGRLCGPFLLLHALVENDLFFVLQRLQNFARLIQQRISQGHRFGACEGFLRCCRGPIFCLARLDFRERDGVEPPLDNPLNLHQPLTLFQVIQNEGVQIVRAALDQFPPALKSVDVQGFTRQ